MSENTQELSIIKQIEHPVSITKFTQIFMGVHKAKAEDAESMYQVEKFNFMRTLQEKNLTNVTPMSAMGVFLEVVSNGLSFAGQLNHVYIMTRSVNVAPKGQKKVYEKRLVYQTSPDGKIFQCQKAGSIDYVTKPVMVYEGDEFYPETDEKGNQILRHKPVFPRKSTKLLAGYVFVVHKNGVREPYWMDMLDVQRLKKYSEKNNAVWDQNTSSMVPGAANALYTSGPDGQIDIGFFGTKLINFALKNKRKANFKSEHQVDDEYIDPNVVSLPPTVTPLTPKTQDEVIDDNPNVDQGWTQVDDWEDQNDVRPSPGIQQAANKQKDPVPVTQEMLRQQSANYHQNQNKNVQQSNDDEPF